MLSFAETVYLQAAHLIAIKMSYEYDTDQLPYELHMQCNYMSKMNVVCRKSNCSLNI